MVNVTSIHKHLGMIFDSKLISKFQGILTRTSLITIYRSFARPHLDYADIIYDQTFNNSLIKDSICTG